MHFFFTLLFCFWYLLVVICITPTVFCIIQDIIDVGLTAILVDDGNCKSTVNFLFLRIFLITFSFL